MFDCEVSSLFSPSLFTNCPDILTDVQQKDPLDALLTKCWKGILPTPVELKYVVNQTSKLLANEPNVIYVDAPVTICGDIHGQFDDLLEIFRISGIPPYSRYLFLGDYVDRGPKSLQVIMLLCVLKLKYPTCFYMLRGNHESMHVTQMYGFRQEVLIRYRSEQLYQAFEPLFNSFPIAAVVGGSMFCVHGGLSQQASTIADINKINRFMEIPSRGILTDLLWGDPTDDGSFFTESMRNAGVRFGKGATSTFLSRNSLHSVIRAHQVMPDGYKYCQDSKVLTIFSAPNYEPMIGNKAAILIIDEQLGQSLIKFKSAPTCGSDLLSSFVY